MFTAFLALLSTLTLTTAAPAPQATTGPAIERTPNFGITLHAADPYNGLVLRAEPDNANLDARALIFERPSAFTPSPAYLNGTADQLNTPGNYAYLNFVNEDKDKDKDECEEEDFGVFLPDIGDGRGFEDPISAFLGLGTASFARADNQIFAQLQAAPNTFAACNTTLNNMPALGLFFVNYETNGSYPYGCVPGQLNTVELPMQ